MKILIFTTKMDGKMLMHDSKFYSKRLDARVITSTAASASLAVGMMYWAGKMKPCLPLSLSSIVYEYLILRRALAQSSDPPEAG